MAGETMNVLVSGDAILDHHIYEGQEPQAMSRIRYGTRQITTGGGAELLFKLLQECRVRVAAASAESRANSPPLNYEPVFGLLELSKCGTAAIENLHLNGYGLYSPFPAFQEASLAERATPKKAAHHVWRLKQSLGYGARDPQRSLTPLAKTDAIRADHQVWLFDDGGLDFRFPRSKSAWPASLQDSPSSASALPEWIVLKTSAPLASGDLWYALTADNLWIERLLVVVSVADLRREPVVVSSGASWERTALDLVQALRANPSLQPLRRCRCLLVMFGVEGALLADCRQGEPRCHLIYDARHLEGDWSGSIEGDVFGRMSCFVTGIVSWLPAKRSRVDVEPNAEITTLLDGARAGLAAARRLVACGHGDIKAAPRLPLGEVADEILSPTITFCHAEVPKDAVPGLSGGTIWRILEAGIDNDTNRLARTLGQAQLVAQFGLQTLPNVPQLKLGKLRTIDRDEIERLRNIRSLIENYRDTPRVKRPLSIGVFGQPGSGKSFAVKELAKAVLGDDV
ncbi:MAG TPA: hypothetical protein VFI31_22720, partial [Pirellulales bacterium]|nr:hypothetical protein [Pirellulales bacterium]